MAVLQDVEVRVQQKHGECWIDLEEFDTTDSLKEKNNSRHHWMTNTVVEEGPFRLVVSLKDSFDWKLSEFRSREVRAAILLNLKCQRGFWFDDHPAIALHPECQLLDRENRYNSLGYMSKNLESERLEYIFESVYTPVEKSVHARTTFNFKKVVSARFSEEDSGAAPRDRLPIDCHSIRLSVDLCKVVRNTYKAYTPTTTQDERQRDFIRQECYPTIDLEPQGRWDMSNVVKKPEGPHYKPEGKPISFNFIYWTNVPPNYVETDDVDIIDKTAITTPRKRLGSIDTVSKRLESPSVASPRLRTNGNSPVIVADRERNQQKPSIMDASRFFTPDQANLDGEHDNSSDEPDCKPHIICTPPLNPTVSIEPVRNVPILASTSATVSNSASGPLPTPTSTPIPTSTHTHTLTPRLTARDIAEAHEQEYKQLIADRDAAISEHRNKLLSLRIEREANEINLQENEAKIADLTARLDDLQLSVSEKNAANHIINKKEKILLEDIYEIEEKKQDDKIAYENVKKSCGALAARAEIPNLGKRRRSQTSLDATPYNGGRRTRDRSSSAMQTDSD